MIVFKDEEGEYLYDTHLDTIDCGDEDVGGVVSESE
jgi:hypothetical protein